jgi:nucleoside-diphosphate kinase
LGAIINDVLDAGFEISALQMVWFDPGVAEKFYEVYKFLPECQRMIESLSSGPSVAIEVRQDNAVEKFRVLCGPYNPEIAKKLEPQSLRAKYGIDRVQNAVHCTDLDEDGPLETNFVFNTLVG